MGTLLLYCFELFSALDLLFKDKNIDNLVARIW
jgi:hypothetical protein